MVAIKRKAPARAARRLLSNQISEPVQRLIVRGERAVREGLPGANHKRASCFREDLQRNRAPKAASHQRINANGFSDLAYQNQPAIVLPIPAMALPTFCTPWLMVLPIFCAPCVTLSPSHCAP